MRSTPPAIKSRCRACCRHKHRGGQTKTQFPGATKRGILPRLLRSRIRPDLFWRCSAHVMCQRPERRSIETRRTSTTQQAPRKMPLNHSAPLRSSSAYGHAEPSKLIYCGPNTATPPACSPAMIDLIGGRCRPSPLFSWNVRSFRAPFWES